MFTPNMTTAQVAEMDRRRGQGDQSTFNNPDGIVRKQPWLNADGTHKSSDEKDHEMPLPAKREGESEFDRDIRHYTKVVEGDPEKYPGGQKQAIAIAAQEAGVSKKSMLVKAVENLKKFVMSSAHAPTGTSAPPGSVTGVASAGGHGGMHSPNASAALGAVSAPKPPKPPGMGGGGFKPPSMGAKPPPVPGMKSMSDVEKCGDGIADMLDGMKETKKSDDATSQAQHSAQQREAARRFGKRERDIRSHQMAVDTSKSLGDDGGRWGDLSKALNSQSMHVLRPLGTFDPYDIQRSGTAVPMHRIAPQELEASFRPAPTYKSCTVHGLMHKSDAGCHLCDVQKSMSCKSCGEALVKQRGNGGAPVCPAGH